MPSVGHLDMDGTSLPVGPDNRSARDVVQVFRMEHVGIQRYGAVCPGALSAIDVFGSKHGVTVLVQINILRNRRILSSAAAEKNHFPVKGFQQFLVYDCETKRTDQEKD